jgi:hypothetical protein
MSEAYLIAAAQAGISSISGKPHIEQIQPALQDLFDHAGAPARRVQEVHWHGGDQEFWLSSLGPSFGFSPGLARFQWPPFALLVHSQLQNSARAIEAGERDLVLLAQEAGDQAILLLLASPAAVGTYNLSPYARLDQKFTLSSAPDGLLQNARAGLEKADQGRDDPVEIQYLASARRLEQAEFRAAFPSALWLGPDGQTPAADLFLLQALASRLVQEKARWGLLLSEGPLKSGLATRVERV